jgi:6-pyruvoyltetrahydropterin/6-carboxytetrahydropterin synthase
VLLDYPAGMRALKNLLFRRDLMLDPTATRLSLLRSLRFCAGHRLFGHEGRCAFFHGHNYRVDVEVEAAGGASEQDAVGRVVDFSLIKRRLLGWLDDHWDHAFLVWEDDANALAAVRMVEPTKYFVMPWNPTAENMARYLLEVVAPHVLDDLGVVARRVAVWETDEACAIATRSGDGGESLVAVATAVTVDDRP